MELDEVRGLSSLLVLIYKQCLMFISKFNVSITTTFPFLILLQVLTQINKCSDTS